MSTLRIPSVSRTQFSKKSRISRPSLELKRFFIRRNDSLYACGTLFPNKKVVVLYFGDKSSLGIFDSLDALSNILIGDDTFDWLDH